ncbi:hypothetical protein [Komagataeibacter medellinensis]|nr:hypothetical protein [Komagataeibacter medellinensis]
MRLFSKKASENAAFLKKGGTQKRPSFLSEVCLKAVSRRAAFPW